MRGTTHRWFICGLVVLVAVTMVIGGFSGCARQEEEVKAPEEWVIPAFYGMTGHSAAINQHFAWASQYAANEINAAGGIAGKPVRIAIYDCGCESPEKGLAEVSKVVDSALVIIGPVPDPVYIGAMPLCVEKGLFSLTLNIIYEFSSPYFPWSISGFPAIDEWNGPPAALWAEKEPDMKTLLPILEKMYCWPLMSEGQSKGVESMGVTVLPTLEIPLDAVTFESVAVKALAQNPDGITLSCGPEKAAKIIMELVKRGWQDTSNILIFYSADDPSLYAAGGEYLDGCYTYTDMNLACKDPKWLAFSEAHQVVYGTRPTTMNHFYNDVVYMVKEAIENTGVTGDPAKLADERIAIRDYIRNADIKGVNFSWGFQDGVPGKKPMFLYQIQAGDKVLIGQTE